MLTPFSAHQNSPSQTLHKSYQFKFTFAYLLYKLIWPLILLHFLLFLNLPLLITCFHSFTSSLLFIKILHFYLLLYRLLECFVVFDCLLNSGGRSWTNRENLSANKSSKFIDYFWFLLCHFLLWQHTCNIIFKFNTILIIKWPRLNLFKLITAPFGLLTIRNLVKSFHKNLEVNLSKLSLLSLESFFVFWYKVFVCKEQNLLL